MTRTAASLALALLLAAPAAASPAGRWYATQLHAHSTYSDGFHSVADMVRWAKAGGLDAMALTDHQTDRHIGDAAWQAAAAAGIVMIPAYEWTRGTAGTYDGGERCHMSVWGIEAGKTPIIGPTATRAEAVAAFTAQGLTFGANHPGEPRYPWPDDDFSDVHAMEVWQWLYGKEHAGEVPPHDGHPHVSVKEFQHRNSAALAMWRQALAQGHHVAPLATADFHVVGPQRLESPCTLVWSATPTADGILAGIRAGHVALVNDPRGARVEIEADADHDGDYEAIAGDTVPAGAHVRVRAARARGLVLTMARAEGEVGRWPITSDAWSRTFFVKPGVYFARADRPGAEWDPLQAMTGALYVVAE
jgi:hypothetical protein